MAGNNKDITNTGALNYRQLLTLNNTDFAPTKDQMNFMLRINQINTAKRSAYESLFDITPSYELSSLMQNGDYWGSSMFDDEVARGEEYNRLEDIRAQNLPWYAQISAGLAKGAVLAGTTFLDGTVGLVVGTATAINEERLSGLWDNDFSKAMQAVNEWAEKVLPNYYTEEEQERPWYENIFTTNFWGDKFIKNLGFTIGALYSGGVISGAIRGAGKLAMAGAKRLGATIGTLKNISKSSSIVATGLGAFTSALNEGRIEAINNSKDWFELHKALIDDLFAQRLQAIKDKYAGTEIYDQLVANEMRLYNQTIERLNEDRLKMGNVDMALNLPILMASNLILFARFYANGFKTARKTLNILGKPGEYVAGDTKKALAPFILKNAASEGTEEISQKGVSTISGLAYEQDVNNFYAAKRDNKSEQDTINWIKAFSQGISETVSEGSSWEEFFIGALTGALGVPLFRGIRNSEGKFQSPIAILNEGYINWKEHNNMVERENEIVNRLNSRFSSPEFINYYQGLIRHNKYQSDMDNASKEGNESDFKNAEHAQLVSDIVMFDAAGKLEDLKLAINEAAGTSIEDLESIIKNTTTKDNNGNLIGPFSLYATTDDNGNITANLGSQESINEMTAKINDNKENLLNTIRQYLDIKEGLLLNYGDRLSDEQLEELTWMKSQIGNWAERATAMSGEVKSAIGNVIGNLDSFLRFNQQVRDFEGQSHADITERYLQADKNVRAIEGAINTLNMVRGQDDKVLAHTLSTNPKFVDGLIKEINEVDETVLSADEKEDITTKLNDIVKLGNASKTYNAKLKEYLENPQKQVEDHTKADEQAAQRETKKKSDDLKTSLNAAPTLRDFRAIIDSQDDTENRDKVLKEMEDEGNAMAKNYRETSQYNTEVRRVINESDADQQAKQDAMKLLQDQFNNSENLEQLANPNSIYINNENAFDEDSEGDVELSATRFQNAQYELQKAMSKVNNDNRFKDRFSPEYGKPVEKPYDINSKLDIIDKTADANREVSSELPESVKRNIGMAATPALVHNKIKQLKEITDKKSFSDSDITRINSLLDDIYGALNTLIAAHTNNQTSTEAEDLIRELAKEISAKVGNKLEGYSERRAKEVGGKINHGVDGNGNITNDIYIDGYLDWLSSNRKSIRGDDRESTGDSQTSTVPSVDTSTLPTTEVPVGNITQEMVEEENKKTNERVETPQRPSRDTLNQFYRPAIPELHIEASKEGDFRPFVDVVAERGKDADFSDIYNYLRDKGAFEYLNQGKLHVGDEIGFMIDPEFEERVKDKEWHKAPTIFMIDKKTGQVVGSLDESDYSISRYEGLKGLEERIRKEFAERATSQESKDDLILITNTHNGYNRLGTLKDWSRATADIRTKPDGFGTENGLHYFKQSHKGGRGGDNITIWFKTEPSQRVKDSIEQLLNDSSNLNEFGDKLANLIRSTQSKGKFVATPTTRVSKIMVGRVPYGNTEKSLRDIPNVSGGSRAPIFGIIKNGVLTTNGKVDDSLIIKPVDMAQKEGRLYLLIPNGAGKYSPTAVRVKHFNNEEFNLDDASVANTPMGKDISATITKLANATSQDDVSQAMQDLAQDLYMQDVMVTWFDGRAGSGIVISKKVRKPDGTYEKVTINGKEQIKEDKYDVYFSTSKKSAEIGGINFDVTALEDLGDTSALGTPKDPNDIYKEILGHLTKFNLPLQVSTRRINNGAYNNRLINSGILTSNITDASVRSTWFTTDYFDNEGNLHQAISPASVTPKPKRKVETPVGGTEGAIAGTKITSVFSNKTYYVDLKTNTIRDDQGKSVEITNDNRILFDLAWAQDNFGSSMNSTVMVDNKILTPSGQVLDRTTQKYITGQEAQDIKDAIAGRKKEREDRVARSKEVISEIYENQKKVDKTRTDGEFYYVLEDDGQYHEYSRVHSRLGSNWVESPKQTAALTQIRTKLSQLVDTPAQYNNYLKFLENKYKINLESYKDKTDAKSRDAIINIVRDLMSGTNSMRALNAGTAVDSVIRQYFTVRDVSKIVRPNNMTENAFIDLIANLNRIKSNMEQMGERFLADNIVLFQKYPDGTRVAGEIDILSVDKDGNFKIYDVKTSRYSFYEFTDRYGHKVNYFTTPSATQRMSAKNYYTLQLSAYKNLFESQYGVPITKLAVMPFVLNYEKEKVSGVLSEKGIPIPYNPAVNVPLVGNVKVDKPVKTPTTSAQESPLLPIYDSSLELLNPIEDLTPEHKFTDKDKVGYFELDGKLHKGYITPLTTINGIEVYLTKVPNITSGFGRQGETAHVASNSYYVVFTNGKTFLALENNPVQGGYSQSQVEQAVSKMLEGNPQKVKDMSNEKTILFDPNAVSTINTTPITTVETPATINQGNTLTGAAYTAQKEQAVMEHDDEFEDEFSLYESKDDDFFNNDNWGKDIKKIQGLNLEVDKEYDLDIVEELFNRFFEGDSEQKDLADRVFKVAKSLGLKIKFDNNFGFGVKGQYANNNIIRYNHKFFTDDFLNNTKSAILLHEVIHATTMYILSDNMQDKLEGNLKEAADAIKEAFDLIKGEKSLAGEYGLTNAKEMIAELANSQFRNKLKKVGIWDRIKNAIKKLFFFDTKPASNAYEVLSRALDVALDNFNIDLYNDYNGVVNYSEVGFNPNEWAFYKSVSNIRKAQISSEVRTWYSSNVFNKYNNNIMIDANNDGYILLDYLYTFHYNKNTGEIENITPIYKNTDYNRNRINKWRERFDKRALGGTEVAFYSSWEQINEEAKNILSKKGWTEEHWNRISQDERDQAIKCIAF